MTRVYDFKFANKDSSTDFIGQKLTIEYVKSSVDNSLKVVQMWRHGKDWKGEVGQHRHELAWMSEQGRTRLFNELQLDYNRG